MGRTHESCERKRRQPRLVPDRVGLFHLSLSSGTAVLVRIWRGSSVKASTAEVGPQLCGRAPLVSCSSLWVLVSGFSSLGSRLCSLVLVSFLYSLLLLLLLLLLFYSLLFVQSSFCRVSSLFRLSAMIIFFIFAECSASLITSASLVSRRVLTFRYFTSFNRVSLLYAMAGHSQIRCLTVSSVLYLGYTICETYLSD